MSSDASKAWLIAGVGFVAAIAIGIGLIAFSSWLVDSADRDVQAPTNAQTW